MPAKPLSPEQIEDAKRLAALVNTYQAKLRDSGQPASQDDVAELFGFGQSAFNQYIRGKIPLNVNVLLRFSEVLQVDPMNISPALTLAQDELVGRWFVRSAAARQAAGLQPLHLSPGEIELISHCRQLPEDRRKQVEVLAENLQPWTPRPTLPTAKRGTEPRRSPAPTPQKPGA